MRCPCISELESRIASAIELCEELYGSRDCGNGIASRLRNWILKWNCGFGVVLQRPAIVFAEAWSKRRGSLIAREKVEGFNFAKARLTFST